MTKHYAAMVAALAVIVKLFLCWIGCGCLTAAACKCCHLAHEACASSLGQALTHSRCRRSRDGHPGALWKLRMASVLVI